MKIKIPKIEPMGERSILIEFEPEINEELLDHLLYFKNFIKNYYVEGAVEVINTYSSLLIYYTHSIEDVYDEISKLKRLFREANIDKKQDKHLYCLPVCYDAEFGLDLKIVSQENGLSFEEIIYLHTQPLYTVYFIGFLPGFLYLGGLDPKLYISRKNEPRLKVEKGAVGIGEKQTGIYPKTSPGGWQIIGRSPVTLFNKNEEPPCIISAGDKIKFFSVSKREYLEIEGEVEAGKFQLKKENYDS